MIKVEIYSKDLCVHCSRAKNLLNNLEIPFTEIDVTNPDELHAMLQRSGGARSVPQIFIDQVHIGGANELSALANRGELQKLIT